MEDNKNALSLQLIQYIINNGIENFDKDIFTDICKNLENFYEKNFYVSLRDHGNNICCNLNSYLEFLLRSNDFEADKYYEVEKKKRNQVYKEMQEVVVALMKGRGDDLSFSYQDIENNIFYDLFAVIASSDVFCKSFVSFDFNVFNKKELSLIFDNVFSSSVRGYFDGKNINGDLFEKNLLLLLKSNKNKVNSKIFKIILDLGILNCVDLFNESNKKEFFNCFDSKEIFDIVFLKDYFKKSNIFFKYLKTLNVNELNNFFKNEKVNVKKLISLVSNNLRIESVFEKTISVISSLVKINFFVDDVKKDVFFSLIESNKDLNIEKQKILFKSFDIKEITDSFINNLDKNNFVELKVYILQNCLSSEFKELNSFKKLKI